MTQHPHEAEWDQHGSYQWTYFSEDVKQLIAHFFRQRLTGRNLDLGGGWYLHYPNSAVVDLSATCLEYNPATEKVHFDLDTLAQGARLPFPDRSFDSATLVSVWQYLRHPDAVERELLRVLKPGAEAYLVNGQGAGVSDCIVGATRSEGIVAWFARRGYDTLVENIPLRSPGEAFRSVCVAMPAPDLFGEVRSAIQQKRRRARVDAIMTGRPERFLHAYMQHEMGEIMGRLALLQEYPVTEHARHALWQLEEYSEEARARTGHAPLIYTDSIAPEIGMQVPGKEIMPTLVTFGGQPLPEGTATPRCRVTYNALRELDPDGIIETPSRDGGPDHVMLELLAAHGLTDGTRAYQARVRDALARRWPDIDERVMAARGHSLLSASKEYKQRRHIDALIARKERILGDGTHLAGTATFAYGALLPHVRAALSAQFMRL